MIEADRDDIEVDEMSAYLTEDLKGALEYEKEVRDHSGVHCSFGNTYLCLPWRVW